MSSAAARSDRPQEVNRNRAKTPVMTTADTAIAASRLSATVNGPSSVTASPHGSPSVSRSPPIRRASSVSRTMSTPMVTMVCTCAEWGS